MTVTDGEPTPSRLVPGLSALTWTRVIRVLWVAYGALFLVGFLFSFVPSLRGALPFSPFILVAVAAILAIGLRFRALSKTVPAERAEVAAGYTTLFRKYPNLDQLDPSTGTVIRKAGEPFLSKEQLRRPPDQSELAAQVRRPSIPARLGLVALWTIGIAVFLVVINGAASRWSIDAFQSYVTDFAVVLVLAGIAVCISSVRQSYILAGLRAAAPGDFVFTFTVSGSNFRSVIQPFLTDEARQKASEQRSGRVSAASAGLTFWRGEPLHPIARLPWPGVLSVQQDTVRIGRRNTPSVAITFRDPSTGSLVALQLVNAEANSLSLHSKGEARWIAAELNALRESKTSARPI